MVDDRVNSGAGCPLERLEANGLSHLMANCGKEIHDQLGVTLLLITKCAPRKGMPYWIPVFGGHIDDVFSIHEGWKNLGLEGHHFTRWWL